MYFPHAFRKSFIPVVSEGAVTLATTGTTADLTAGKLGVFDSTSWAALTVASTKPFILAQGSYYTNDKISPALGGYKESVKSKVINPRYISRVIKVTAETAQNQVVSVAPAVGCAIKCDDTYRLRIDLKGSPALRFLSHNVYYTVDAYTGCCDADGSNVDPNVVLLQWADRINEYPLVTPFVRANVWNKTTASVAIDPTSGSATIKVANADAALFSQGEKVVADGIPGNTLVVSVGAADSGGVGYTNVVLSKAATSSTNVNAKIFTQITTATYVPVTGAGVANVEGTLDISVAYAETKFGSCTFTPTDFYELQPLQIYTSFVDQSGDPCEVKCISSTEIQAPRQASGLGETVLRELILDGTYRQEAFPDSSRVDSFRMREIESNPKLLELSSVANRNSLFDQVLILHSVPRFNNPTGTFDNDQYLLVVHVPTGTSTTDLTNFVVASANAAQGTNAIALETY